MNSLHSPARRIALFAMLTALSLVLGWVDRAVPLSALLGGGIPGIKLGLANTVLLYGVYMLPWQGCLLLMLAKVGLSGFLFGSLTAMLYSLAGGVLSLSVMLAVRRRPDVGALGAAVLSGSCAAALLRRNPAPQGQLLWYLILMLLACVGALAVFILLRRKHAAAVVGTSLAGAVSHNVGQILVAAAMLQTPRLLLTYLPILVGIGAAVGCLTGIAADRVFHALRIPCAGNA